MPVQTVPQEDGGKVRLQVDDQAQLWPETSQCNLFSKHTGPVTRKVQQVETCKFELTSLEATGCAYSTDLNVGTPWLNFITVVSQYAGKTVGATRRLWVRLQAVGQNQGNMPWDLEEGGGLGREPQPGSVQTSDITSPLSYITAHLSTSLTNPATIPPFPSPESSNEHTCFVSHHTSKIREPQHMVALRMRWKKAKAGSLLSIIRDLSSPPCDFIHCSCAQCQIFRQDSETWQPGSCRAVVGCKCPRCWLYYDSTGHWDSKRAANAKLHCDMAGFNVSKVCDTLQPTYICSRTQSVMIDPTNRPAWHRQLEWYRQRRAAQAESRASLMEGRATTPEVVVMSPRKITTPVAQHQALVRRMPKQPTSQTPVFD